MITQYTPFSFQIDQIILTITLIIIYLVFFFYELFKRKEHLEYLVYLAATVPFGYLWAIGLDFLTSVFFLMLLWTFALARDLVLYYVANQKNKRDYANSVIVYGVSIGIFFLYAAILPAIFPDIKTRYGTQSFGNIIWLPVLDLANPMLNPFRMILTLDIAIVIIPIIIDVKRADTHVSVWGNIFLSVIFTLPTLYVIYIWLLVTGFLFVVGLLIGVLYFILLLILTRGK
ncbi:MAG: hypothetical protein ACTSVI_01265 [Promethearchaeota archaeon]